MGLKPGIDAAPVTKGAGRSRQDRGRKGKELTGRRVEESRGRGFEREQWWSVTSAKVLYALIICPCCTASLRQRYFA
jgi:hypothetical protein